MSDWQRFPLTIHQRKTNEYTHIFLSENWFLSVLPRRSRTVLIRVVGVRQSSKPPFFQYLQQKKTNFMKYELKRNLLIVTIIIGALLPWISDNIETAKCNFWTGWMVSLQKWLIHIFSAKFVQSAFVTGFPKRYKTSRSKIRMSIV